ncbi:N-acetyl-beta-D-glucosaminidase [Clostridia bacterium]|nr:N-acetyl-beta-D-glucosaminidase [Clostridia bacterium]
MFTPETVARLRDKVFALVGCTFAGEITAEAGEGLAVSLENNKGRIRAADKTALARGFFLLARALARGETRIDIAQQRRFADCGAYLDMSRGGVMHVPALKRYIDAIAALGMNMLMLYTEDTYTLPDYRYFGYLRGRYTKEELIEADAYAASMGVELVPSIQTLAHLGQFLQWQESDALKDTPTCLMIDDPDTYRFIAAEIRAVRACFRSKRVHIGMDEAHGVGLDRYFARHGLVDRFALLNRHLGCVVELCRANGFEPIMWSDMFFRLGSKTNEYYDMDAVIPQSVIDAMPDVALAYWDYYHEDEATYEFMLTEHERMGKPLVFAGGVWTWSGFLPHVRLTYATMLPALRACARHHVPTVLATLWGDDGTETNYFLALSQLPIFSEFCWRGPDCTLEEIEATGAFLTGLPAAAYRAFGDFYEGSQDLRTGKGLVYCDLLYPLLSEKSDLNERIAAYENARAALAPSLSRADCQYADALFALVAEKAKIIAQLRARYLAGDRDYLAEVARTGIPGLIARYGLLGELHRAQWESTFKRNGWEQFALRYGAVTGRLRDVQEAIERYLAGELDTLCELDEAPLPSARKVGMQFYNVYVTPQFAL